MTIPAFKARSDELAKHLSDLRTGIKPATLYQADFRSTISSLRLELRVELAAVALAVSIGHIASHTHGQLHQSVVEVSANYFLAVTPPFNHRYISLLARNLGTAHLSFGSIPGHIQANHSRIHKYAHIIL